MYTLSHVPGMLEYETKELLKKHIDAECYYTLDYLNEKIGGIELGYMEKKDRPSMFSQPILRSTDHKLKQEGKHITAFMFYVHVLILTLNNAQLHKCGC